MSADFLRKGQRVKLSAEGIAANLVRPKHHERLGTVAHDQRVALGCSVLWDGLKHSQSYARRFITPVRRPR